jgi:acyl-CoA reductase-like NAD-dependent aldehyde dehydrogenase
MMSGQVCAMLSRVIVPRARHDELAEAIAGEMRQVVIGHSDDPRTQLGPLAMKRQRDRVEMYIEEGRKVADLVCGGGRPAHLNQGYFIEPTVFANVRDEMAIARDEIFGPVMSILPFKGVDEIIERANSTYYGLAAAVWTRDIARAHEVAKRLRAGTVWVNCYDVFDAAAPFGGFKQSGFGRELGERGLDPYLETKTVTVSLD